MLVKDLQFIETPMCNGEDTLYTSHVENVGRITVLHRMTGYYDCYFDTETGFRDMDNKFWLASGNFDIRSYSELTLEEAIAKIKQNANTCIGV